MIINNKGKTDKNLQSSEKEILKMYLKNNKIFLMYDI